jgi:hypothetical protein
MTRESIIEEELSGSEFILGIMPYNGRRFLQYSQKKYFIHPDDYFKGIFNESPYQLSTEHLKIIADRISERDFKLNHCHIVTDSIDYPPDKLGEYEKGDSQSICFSSGGRVKYESKEIRHKGLLNSLKASLLLEVFTQLDLIEIEQENVKGSEDYHRCLKRISKRYKFPTD